MWTHLSPNADREKTKQQQRYTRSRLILGGLPLQNTIITSPERPLQDRGALMLSLIPPSLCFSSLGAHAPESLWALPGNLNLLNPFPEEPGCLQSLSVQGGHLTLTRAVLLILNEPLFSQPLIPNLHRAHLSSLWEHSLPSKFLYHCNWGWKQLYCTGTTSWKPDDVAFTSCV